MRKFKTKEQHKNAGERATRSFRVKLRDTVNQQDYELISDRLNFIQQEYHALTSDTKLMSKLLMNNGVLITNDGKTA